MQQEYLWQKMGLIVQEGFALPGIQEIMLNPNGDVWFKHAQHGNMQAGSMSQTEAENFVHAVANYSGKFISDKTPYLDEILPFGGERINVTTSPITPGISFNIRLKTTKEISLKEYVQQDVLNLEQFHFLVDAIKSRKNILVSGAPASGKTTFVNAILKKISEVESGGHRILILEQIPELECALKNTKKMQESTTVNMNKLLWICMRNTPDRIVIGEVRDSAALDMLKAFNTGCPGGLATIHANTPKLAIQRIIDLCMEAVANPPYALIAATINIIVQIAVENGKRKVTSIAEVESFDSKTKRFNLTEIL